jgi:hypothetical protein
VPASPGFAPTHRLVIHLVIHVDETPIDVGQSFNLVLQLLRDIVSSPQRHFGVKDNVNFDKVSGARVVHSAGVDLLDLG